VIKSTIPTKSKYGIKTYHGRREIQEHPNVDNTHNSRNEETDRKVRENVLTDRKKETADSIKSAKGYPNIQRETCPRLSSRHTAKIDATQGTERVGNHVESARHGQKRNKLPTREKVVQPSHQKTEESSAKSQVYLRRDLLHLIGSTGTFGEYERSGSREQLQFLECSPNYPRASITRYTQLNLKPEAVFLLPFDYLLFVYFDNQRNLLTQTIFRF